MGNILKMSSAKQRKQAKKKNPQTNAVHRKKIKGFGQKNLSMSEIQVDNVQLSSFNHSQEKMLLEKT